MTTHDINEKIVNQLSLVVERAQEVFVNQLEADAEAGELGFDAIDEVDKRKIERLFSQTVYGHVFAEVLALFGVVIHGQSKDDSILTQTVPSFLSACEAKFEEMIPESAVEKADGLPQRAIKAMENREGKTDMVISLMEDMANMTQVSPLRASYDAVVLALLGE